METEWLVFIGSTWTSSPHPTTLCPNEWCAQTKSKTLDKIYLTNSTEKYFKCIFQCGGRKSPHSNVHDNILDKKRQTIRLDVRQNSTFWKNGTTFQDAKQSWQLLKLKKIAFKATEIFFLKILLFSKKQRMKTNWVGVDFWWWAEHPNITLLWLIVWAAIIVGFARMSSSPADVLWFRFLFWSDH